MNSRGPGLACLTHVSAGIGIDVVRIDLERDGPEASNELGWTIGISLVVRSDGQAMLLPALA